MFIAVSPAATVESWMSCGATAYALRTSAEVGVRWGAPGTSLSSLTVLTSPDAVSNVSGYFWSWVRVKWSTNVTVGWRERVGRLHVDTELTRRVDLAVEHVEVLDHLRMLVDPLGRVGLQHELALDEDAAREDDQARDHQRGCERSRTPIPGAR